MVRDTPLGFPAHTLPFRRGESFLINRPIRLCISLCTGGSQYERYVWQVQAMV